MTDTSNLGQNRTFSSVLQASELINVKANEAELTDKHVHIHCTDAENFKVLTCTTAYN